MLNDDPDSQAERDRDPPATYGITPPAYRLPAGMRLGPVRLQVSDLARSLDYYRDVLGMRALGEDSGVAQLAAAGSTAPLVELRERKRARPVPSHGRLGLYHFAILLPDRPALGRFLVHLAAAGVHAGAADHLVSEALYLSDPDGLGIEVYADRPRAQWRAADRQLRMATDPLDATGLVRAADGEPWIGMPEGTTMGHVHLHVGDLAAARSFYHAAIGFDVIVWSYPGALFLSAGGYHHHLGLNTWARGASPAGDDDARLLSWEIVLPDTEQVEAIAHNVIAAGYDVTAAEDGRSITDPWGTMVRLRVAAARRESSAADTPLGTLPG